MNKIEKEFTKFLNKHILTNVEDEKKGFVLDRKQTYENYLELKKMLTELNEIMEKIIKGDQNWGEF